VMVARSASRPCPGIDMGVPFIAQKNQKEATSAIIAARFALTSVAVGATVGREGR
jgi:hypothetical protein